MANYLGLVFNTEGSAYGSDMFAQGHSPQYFIQTKEHEANLNLAESDEDSLSTEIPRGAYPEPEGSATMSAHTKGAPTLMYSLLGNYVFTEDAVEVTLSDGTKVDRNLHEFWMGENSELPDYCGSFTYGDFMRKTIYGGVTDSLTWTAGLEKTEVELGFVYRHELSQKINIESIRQNFNVLQALPLVGYDYAASLTILENNSLVANCFKEVSIEVNNNLITGDDIRCLGQRKYGIRPSSESKEIEISLTTKFDRRNYEIIMAAMYGNANVDSDGWYGLEDCKTFTAKFELYASACTEEAEAIRFIFPCCYVTVDSITAENNNIEATIKLKPNNSRKVTLNNGTKINTPMYVRVRTEADELE